MALAKARFKQVSEAGFVVRKLAKELRRREGFLCHASAYSSSRYVCKGDKRPNLCGTSGCGLVIFAHGKSGWRYFIDVATTRPPIRILPTRTHRWHDLSSWQYGGGVYHAYEAWWQFNCRDDYRNFRTKWKEPKRIQGRVIIKDATIPLFPSKCHRVEEAPSAFRPMPITSDKPGSC